MAFRYLCVLLACFFIAKITQSQDYTPFPIKDAVWSQYFGTKDCFEQGLPGWAGTRYHYATYGDTIIDSIIYTKVFRDGHFGCPGTHWGTQTGYFGAFRNDSANKKMYFIHSSMNKEVLLYDFNLKVGDTIKNWFTDSLHSSKIWVDSIDSISIIGNYRKVFYYRTDWPYIVDGEIIEGIGCLDGVFECFSNRFENSSSLGCHSVGDSTLYPPWETDTCERYRYTGIKDPYSIPTKSLVYPNPARERLFIEEIEDKKHVFELFDLSGKRLIYKENAISVDISNLDSGYYIVTLSFKDRIEIHRVIKE